jgi:hypothetical protein
VGQWNNGNETNGRTRTKPGSKLEGADGRNAGCHKGNYRGLLYVYPVLSAPPQESRDAARVMPDLRHAAHQAAQHRRERRGAREGVFRDGVDPVQLYVSIAALGYFYLSNNHTLSTIFGRDLLAPRAKAQRLRHMVELVQGFLARP